MTIKQIGGVVWSDHKRLDAVAYEVLTSEGRCVRVPKDVFDQFPANDKRVVKRD